MARMNRHDWTDNHRALHPKDQGRAAPIGQIKREVRRRLLADGLIESTDTPRFEWYWCTADGVTSGAVKANTKSEARARIKAVLGTNTLPAINFAERIEIRQKMRN